MRIRVIEITRLDLVLLNVLRTGVGEHGRRPVLLLHVITEAAEGFGECSALAEPNYTEEYVEGAEAVLCDHLIPRVMHHAGEGRDLAGYLELLDGVRGHPMAKSGLEMALLDASLREQGRSFGAFLGATNASIPAGANISFGPPDQVVAAAQLCVDAGYERVKCKIAPGFDVASVRALRESFPNLALAVDANGSYDLQEAEHHKVLQVLDDLGLTFIEQPLAPDDLLEHASLAAELHTPVMLDESITSMGLLRLAISIRAGDGVCVKPARVGGVLAAKAMHDLCREEGLHLAIGGMLETGVGRAAALAVGALPGFDLAGDLGGSERYFAPDLTVPHELEAGRLLVPRGPGLGIELIESVVASARVRGRVFQAS